MKGTSAEDARLVRLSALCLALPEVRRRYNGQHAAFLIRDRTFAYYLDDHHGDGIVAVSVKAAPGETEVLAGVDPSRFYVPSYVGPRGWVALRLDVGRIDWPEVADFVLGSYRLIAPKRLAMQTEDARQLMQRAGVRGHSAASRSAAKRGR